MLDSRSVPRAHGVSRAGDALGQQECMFSLIGFANENARMPANHGSKQATVRYPTFDFVFQSKCELLQDFRE